jgi:hypothetical protein
MRSGFLCRAGQESHGGPFSAHWWRPYVLATLAHRGNAGARLQRLQDRASEQPEIAPDTKTETEIKKISAPNLTISIRSERVALLVLDGAIPANYFEPLDPSLPPKKPSGRV